MPPRAEPGGAAAWTALLLAGERPGGNPLAEHFGVPAKALLPLAGKPMIEHVLQTLLATPRIARILILTQTPAALTAPDTAWIAEEPRIACAPSGDGIARSIAAVAGSATAPWPLLVTTADHPLLTPATIDAFLDGAGYADVAVGVVERAVIRAAWPDSRRTWLRFRGGAYSGANLFALRGSAARPAVDAWAAVERDRKKAFRLLWRLGPWLTMRALTRSITLDRAIGRAGARMGLRAVAVSLPFAEAAMDVDSVADAQIAARILDRRRAG